MGLKIAQKSPAWLLGSIEQISNSKIYFCISRAEFLRNRAAAQCDMLPEPPEPFELTVLLLQVLEMCFTELISSMGPFAEDWPIPLPPALADAPAPDSVPVTFTSCPT